MSVNENLVLPEGIERIVLYSANGQSFTNLNDAIQYHRDEPLVKKILIDFGLSRKDARQLINMVRKFDAEHDCALPDHPTR